MAMTPHGDEDIPRDERTLPVHLEDRISILERRLDALEETVRSLALELRSLYEGTDADEELT
jgi:hypothetical protein